MRISTINISSVKLDDLYENPKLLNDDGLIDQKGQQT